VFSRTLFLCSAACMSAPPRGGGDCWVPRAMSDAAAWAPVQVRTETVIRGGLSRKLHVLAIERFEFEERQASFVIVSPSEGWLCDTVAQQVASRRPLARSTIFKLLRDAFAPAAADSIDAGAAQDDRMQDLGFEDSPSSSQSPPSKKWKRSQGYKGVTVRTVKVPSDPPSAPALAGHAGQDAVAADREVLAATKLNKLFLEVDALPWLVCYLRREFDAVCEEAVCVKLWWDIRDECWVCRKPLLPGDKPRRQRNSVRSRIAPGGDLQHMNFEEAKHFCYDELVCSLGIGDPAAVAAGLPLVDGASAAATAAMS
jgi:hypothetical protein